MKRTLSVTLVVGGLLLATLTLLLGRQSQMLAMQEARAAEERVRALADALPPVSLPGEQGGAGSASPVELPAVEPTRREAPSVVPGDNVAPDAVGDDRPAAVPTNDAVVGGADELKVFRLQNADAAETLRAIQPLLPPDAKVSADQRTNSLIVSANPDRLVIITALLIALDEAPGKKRLPLPGQPDPKSGYVPPNPATTNWPVAAVFKNDQDSAMDREAKHLAAHMRAAKEPEKSKLRAELELLTEKHFELRQQRRAAEIAELADRVDKLRVGHHNRQENKSDIIKRRLADLLDEGHELKWDDTRRPLPTLPVATPKSVPQTQPPNLDGEWLVTLPTGIELVGRIEKQPEGCWSFQEMQSLSGYYQLEGNMLKAVITDKKQPQEYEWQILNDNVMVLTKSPPQEKIGSDYRGATLRRGGKPNERRSATSLSPRPKSGVSRQASEPQTDYDRLRGFWILEESSNHGGPWEPSGVRALHYSRGNQRFTIRKDDVVSHRFSLSEDSKPKVWKCDDLPQNANDANCAYELSGDRLTIAFRLGEPAGPPESLTPADGLEVGVFRRLPLREVKIVHGEVNQEFPPGMMDELVSKIQGRRQQGLLPISPEPLNDQVAERRQLLTALESDFDIKANQLRRLNQRLKQLDFTDAEKSERVSLTNQLFGTALLMETYRELETASVVNEILQADEK